MILFVGLVVVMTLIFFWIADAPQRGYTRRMQGRVPDRDVPLGSHAP